MDIKINVEKHNSLGIDNLNFKKMLFIFNALENGWSVKKKQQSYIFSKNHEGKKEIFDENYLAIFVKENSNINNFFS
jgi:hypothetical protein